jgi:hypothetical protein
MLDLERRVAGGQHAARTGKSDLAILRQHFFGELGFGSWTDGPTSAPYVGAAPNKLPPAASQTDQRSRRRP